MTAAGDIQRHMRGLPFAHLEEILEGKPALILAPHPDDESLGCGGLIAAACAAGFPPIVVIITDGTGSHRSSKEFPPDCLRALREDEANEATVRLGLHADRLVFLRLPDTAVPKDGVAFQRIVEVISALALTHGCGSLIATWLHDPHGDHEATYMIAAETALRVRVRLLAYPVWGWTLSTETEIAIPLPNGVRFDISDHLQAKRAAIAAHRSQHGLVITDAVESFCLPPDLLSVFDRPYEVFLRSSL